MPACAAAPPPAIPAASSSSTPSVCRSRSSPGASRPSTSTSPSRPLTTPTSARSTRRPPARATATTAGRASGPCTTPATTGPSSSTPTATTSRSSTTTGADGSEQRLRERRPRRARNALLAEGLHADVVGAGVEMRAHDLGDLLRAALRDDRVEQPVGAAVGEVVLREAEVEQVARVVAQAEVERRVLAGDGLRARPIVLDDARHLGRDQLVGAEPLAGRARVLDRHEVRVRAGGALAGEVEHLRAERREAALLARRRVRRGVEAVEERPH